MWIFWFSNKIGFKQSFKYLNNEKINLSKVILKPECLFYLNIYILFYLILYSKSHFDSNKSKKRSNRKKSTPDMKSSQPIYQLCEKASQLTLYPKHLSSTFLGLFEYYWAWSCQQCRRPESVTTSSQQAKRSDAYSCCSESTPSSLSHKPCASPRHSWSHCPRTSAALCRAPQKSGEWSPARG